MNAEAPDACPLQAKFAATRRELADALIERDDEIDLALTALVAREHLLLVGPPGCGKSLLLDSAAPVDAAGASSPILLTKFTTPEEVVGPISISRPEGGPLPPRHRRPPARGRPGLRRRDLEGQLGHPQHPPADPQRAGLRERRRVGPRCRCGSASRPPTSGPAPRPARSSPPCSTASSSARRSARSSPRPGRERLLWGRDHTPRLSTSITPAEVDAAHAAAAAPALVGRRQARPLEADPARAGQGGGRPRRPPAVQGRRRGPGVRLAVRRGEVLPEHLEVLAHVLWDDPAEQPEKGAQVIARIANPVGMRVNQLLLEGEAILAATDVRDLGQAATATAKLGEIDKQLDALDGDPRAAAGAGLRPRADQADQAGLHRGHLSPSRRRRTWIPTTCCGCSTWTGRTTARRTPNRPSPDGRSARRTRPGDQPQRPGGRRVAAPQGA